MFPINFDRAAEIRHGWPLLIGLPRVAHPGCAVRYEVSAHTGEGIDELRALVERDLPRPAHEVHALVPYERGELVARVHERGEVLSLEHTETGTLLHVQTRWFASNGHASSLSWAAWMLMSAVPSSVPILPSVPGWSM